MRYFGLTGRILGDPQLFAGAHVRSSAGVLLAMHDTLQYLNRKQIRVYRLPSQLLAGGFESDDWHALGQLAESLKIRLTYHLDLCFVLNSPDPVIQRRSVAAIERISMIFQHLNTADPVIVAHLGGGYEDRKAALARCVATLRQLSPTAQAMLALEPDGRVWSLVDVLHVYAQTGIAVVYDHLHHQLLNPQQIDSETALNYALATWPPERKPKIHFSSPRTELRINANGKQMTLEQPQWYEHSDYAHPFELIALLAQKASRDYDVMLECKAGDLAIERARHDVARFAPEMIDVA